MQDVTYRLDQSACDSIHDLMKHYNASDSAQVIKKSLALLRIAAYVEQTDGEMIIRKGTHETKLIVK